MYYFGCDPGWTNLAYAWVGEEGELVETGCLVPKDLKCAETPEHFCRTTWVPLDELGGAAMERFVYYDGIHNPNSEQILMVTGQIQHWLRGYEEIPTMFKAYDWKSRLSKHLYKKGFRNPSDRFDKVFSMAAAEYIFNIDFKTDHEADAACLAYIAYLMNR